MRTIWFINQYQNLLYVLLKRAGTDAPTPFVLSGMPITYVIDRQGRAAGYITGMDV